MGIYRHLTIDCCSRTSLKGFLLGYRKVTIGNNLLIIKPLSPEEIDGKLTQEDFLGSPEQLLKKHTCSFGLEVVAEKLRFDFQESVPAILPACVK